MPVTEACASGVAPLSQGTGDHESSATPPVTGARASSATPLSYPIIQATGAGASGVAPLSLGTGACTSSAARPATRCAVVRLLCLHVARFSEGVLSLPLPGKDDTETLRSQVELDWAFPRNGYSALFSVILSRRSRQD